MYRFFCNVDFARPDCGFFGFIIDRYLVVDLLKTYKVAAFADYQHITVTCGQFGAKAEVAELTPRGFCEGGITDRVSDQDLQRYCKKC